MDEAIEFAIPGKPLKETPFSANEGAILNRVRELCGWKRLTFPGSQPVSLSSSNLSQLGSFPYVACEKSDGVRYLMLAASRKLFLVDRKETIQMLNMTAPLPGLPEDDKGDLICHQSTLLDGEMVCDRWPNGEKRVSFLIYDAIAINKDVTVGRRNLLERLKRVLLEFVRPRQELEKERENLVEAEKKSNNYINIYLKDFFEIFDIMAIRNTAKRLPHLSDGIIFTPVALPYIPGTCRQLMKWKPPELNTLDFASEILYALDGTNNLVTEEWVPVGSKLLIGSRGFRVDSGNWIVPFRGGWSNMIKRMQERNDCDGAIWECYFDPKAKTIIPNFCSDLTLVATRVDQWKNFIKKGNKKARKNLTDVDDMDSILPDDDLCKLYGYPAFACPLAKVGGSGSSGAWYDFNDKIVVDGGWVLERIRTDKTTPNDERVMVKIKESIDSGISIEALYEYILSLKAGIKTCHESCQLPVYYSDHGCRIRHNTETELPEVMDEQEAVPVAAAAAPEVEDDGDTGTSSSDDQSLSSEDTD